MSKSYWQSVNVRGAGPQEAVKSWFGIMADETDVVNDADILCDKATDREKKIRAVLTNKEGDRFKLERTLGGKTFSIKRTFLEKAKERPADAGDGCASSRQSITNKDPT